MGLLVFLQSNQTTSSATAEITNIVFYYPSELVAVKHFKTHQ